MLPGAATSLLSMKMMVMMMENALSASFSALFNFSSSSSSSSSPPPLPHLHLSSSHLSPRNPKPLSLASSPLANRASPPSIQSLHNSCSSSSHGGRSNQPFLVTNHASPASNQPLHSSGSSSSSSSDASSSSSSSSSGSSSHGGRTLVSVFWDLDNKPPKVPPYHAAVHLKHTASAFGNVVDMVAYANRHAFLHVPQWVREERQQRRQQDRLEQLGLVKAEFPYVCGMCGRKCKTNLLLKKHFKQLHERERQKRMNRLDALKGKKRTKYKAQVLSRDERYKDAARTLFVPKVGYGLATELRRAGVYVRTVEDKPQAADRALKRRIANSISSGVQSICLVSDDSDFSEMLRAARARDLRTIVIGDTKALQRYADVWYRWDDVARGIAQGEAQEATDRWPLEQNLVKELSDEFYGDENPRFDLFRGLETSPAYSGRGSVQEEDSQFAVHSMPLVKVSAFSEEEADVDDEEVLGEDSGLADQLWTLDDEEDEDDDIY